MSKIMVFPRLSEYEKAKAKLNELNLEYKVINPPNNYKNIAVPSIIFEQETYAKLISSSNGEFIFSGCVEYSQSIENTEEEQAEFDVDIFGNAHIMVITPCVADETKVRLIIHLSEDISSLLPYLNTYLKSAFYNDDAQSLTFMEQHRLITIYKNRIAIARANEITDAWRIIWKIRNLINTVNQNKGSITPSYEMRKKPPALEIYNRLPKINCGQCQPKTCMAFAFALHSGTVDPFSCKPIFEGDHKQLLDSYMEICSRIGAPIVG